MTAAGYVLNVDENRRDELLQAIEEDEAAAEAVPEFEQSRNVPLICFLSFDRGLITHLGRARRGQRAGTGLRRLNISDVLELEDPIEHYEILRRCPPKLRKHADARLSGGGLVPPSTFLAVVEALAAISYEARTYLAPYSSDRRQRIARIPAAARFSLAAQKETVATALALAGIDRHVLEGWDPSLGRRSFLDGLPAARLREDAVVASDLSVVPGFELIGRLPFGAAVFENDRTRLTVILANHLPLEQQTGADLLYYNETYHSFIFVQYKMMERSNSGGSMFRLPDSQLAAEIDRMRSLIATLSSETGEMSPDSFRLLENPCFLKFCPRLVFNPDDIGLSSGMYLPLDLWTSIASSELSTGPHGGRYIDFNNVSRYLDNSHFIALVSNAWVGTTIRQSSLLEPFIAELASSGRSIALAVKTSIDVTVPDETTMSADSAIFIEPSEE